MEYQGYPSCDTFVVLSPHTENGCMIFGKNSDRPGSEVQEVIFVPENDHQPGTKTQCTYIEVPAAEHTHSVILSKPAWMWGAEIGANQHGVCIGNEAVFTKTQGDGDKEEKLLGMDLVRLGLERGKTSKEALDIITSHLEQFGQGGRCFEDPSRADIMYHNSFIIADGTEAWVLETAGKHWVAEQVTSGVRNISNKLSIGTKIDAMSDNLKEFAQEKGLWDGSGDFDFAKAFLRVTNIDEDGIFSPTNRYNCGKDLLAKFSKDNKFSVMSMIDVLRDEKSGICRVGLGTGGSVSTGSQVSLLYPAGGSKLNCHWFTATPNPACSVFKPFIFVPDVAASSQTASPTYSDDPAKSQPRFQSQVDRQHDLYREHSKIRPLPGDNADQEIVDALKNVEKLSVQDIEEIIEKNSFDDSFKVELKDLFKDCVETEIKFYRFM